ncbi:MAG: hypothetical protein M3321_08135 [Actinomycetota bacterium]|nr:hypothetical protein [Actinomycetota bacterium]
MSQLQSLEEGEIVVRGTTPRVYGPYAFARGGYVLQFDQPAPSDATRLVVALESKPNSKSAPYQLLVDTEDRSGTRRVTLSGNLYVHVLTSTAGYELRFTPRAP